MYSVVLPFRDTSPYPILLRLVRWLVQFRCSFGRRTLVSSCARLIVDLFYYSGKYCVYWRFSGSLIYSIGNNPTIVAISSSIVYFAYHLQFLPGGSLTTHCVERCILYRSLLFIILVAIKSETVCLNRPSTSIFKHFLLH